MEGYIKKTAKTRGQEKRQVMRKPHFETSEIPINPAMRREQVRKRDIVSGGYQQDWWRGTGWEEAGLGSGGALSRRFSVHSWVCFCFCSGPHSLTALRSQFSPQVLERNGETTVTIFPLMSKVVCWEWYEGLWHAIVYLQSVSGCPGPSIVDSWGCNNRARERESVDRHLRQTWQPEFDLWNP